MSAVTVDADDLEALIFAASVIKPIETALSAHKRDPFVTQHLQNTDALERITTAWRHAKRAAANDTLVKFDEPLTGRELKLLREYAHNEHDLEFPYSKISGADKAPKSGQTMSTTDQLMCKGCVQVGQEVRGVVWSGAPGVSDVVRTGGFAVKITPKGWEKLREAGNAALKAS